MNSDEYTIIMDTNILYQGGAQKADFTIFAFSKNFYEVVDRIEELDIYGNIKIAIPIVVWRELHAQILEIYVNKFSELKNLVEKYNFPQVNLQIESIDYKAYISQVISDYKKMLDKRLVDIIDLPLPSETRFSSIINRAFEKRQPFEGNKSKSDKGFKDALLWESVIEYKQNNIEQSLIVYTNDKQFGDELKKEYKSIFNDEIQIIRKDNDGQLMHELGCISQKINGSSYLPTRQQEQYTFNDWIYSDSFVTQLEENGFQFGPERENLKVIDIEPQSISIIKKTETDVLADVDFLVGFTTGKGEKLRSRYSLTILADNSGNSFSITDVYLSGDEGEEGDEC